MRFLRQLKTVGLVVAMAGILAPAVEAQELRDRYLEIKKEYEKNHPGTPQVKAEPIKPVQLFPNATRAEPGLAISNAMAKPIGHLQDLANSGASNDETIAAGLAIAAEGGATAYDRARVFQILGYAYLDSGDDAKSVESMQKSLDQNALSNNDHYSLMLQIARTQVAMGQADAALATLARIVAETRQDKPEYDGLRGRMHYLKKDYAAAAVALQKFIDGPETAGAGERDMLLDSYSRLKQYAQAEKVGEDILRAQPDDKSAIATLAAVYRQDGHADKALALIGDARKRGVLTAADEARATQAPHSVLK